LNKPLDDDPARCDLFKDTATLLHQLLLDVIRGCALSMVLDIDALLGGKPSGGGIGIGLLARRWGKGPLAYYAR